MYFIHNVDENTINIIHHKYWSAFVGYLCILEKTLCMCRRDFVTRDVHYDKQLHTNVKSTLRAGMECTLLSVTQTKCGVSLICMNYHQIKKYSGHHWQILKRTRNAYEFLNVTNETQLFKSCISLVTLRNSYVIMYGPMNIKLRNAYVSIALTNWGIPDLRFK